MGGGGGGGGEREGGSLKEGEMFWQTQDCDLVASGCATLNFWSTNG